MEENENPKTIKEKELIAIYDPLSEFNILSFVPWNDETLRILSDEWQTNGEYGLNITQFVHSLLKVFPKPDRRNPNQKRIWVQKLISFYNQIDYDHNNCVQWQEFLSFITACCVFDREKTRVDTVVQYHFKKEVSDRSGNFCVHKFIYDSTNDRIISFNTNGGIYFYSPSSMSLIKKITLHGRPINAVYDGAIIAERAIMAVCYPTGIQIISIVGGCPLAQDISTIENSHFCIMYEPTSHLLFTGSEDGFLHCWQAENWGEKPSRMNWRAISKTKVTISKAVTVITLIPDSDAFATGDEEGNLIVWDKKNIRLIHKIPAHHAPIHSIVHSESLHALITSAYETTVCVWNPFIPFLISRIDCPTGIVTAMTCLPDSPHLVIADRGGNLHIINSRTMSIVQTFSLSPFGQFASKVNLTHTSTQQLSRSILMTGTYPVSALCHCGPRMLFVLGGRIIQFYEYEENIQPMLSDKVPIRCALMNHQFHTICTSSGTNLRLWEVSSGLMRCVFRDIAPSLITSMAMDDAQTVLFIGCHSGEIIAVHFPTGQLLHRIGQHSSEITGLYYSKRLKLLLSSGWGGVLSLWKNSPDGHLIDLITEKKDDILCFAVSDEYMLIAAGTGCGSVLVWSLIDLKLVAILTSQKTESEIIAISFVEKSTLIVATDADGCITFWSIKRGPEMIVNTVAQLPNFYSESSTSNILALTVCERFLITGDSFGECRLWDVSQLIQQFPLPHRVDDSDIGDFPGLIKQRGKQALAYQSKLQITNAEECVLPVGCFQLILKWKAHHSGITGISTFEADGSTVVLTSSNDCSAAVWQMRTGRCLGFLQSNPAFGMNERKWVLKYDPKKDQTISMEEVLSIMHAAEAIPNSP